MPVDESGIDCFMHSLSACDLVDLTKKINFRNRGKGEVKKVRRNGRRLL